MPAGSFTADIAAIRKPARQQTGGKPAIPADGVNQANGVGGFTAHAAGPVEPHAA